MLGWIGLDLKEDRLAKLARQTAALLLFDSSVSDSAPLAGERRVCILIQPSRAHSSRQWILIKTESSRWQSSFPQCSTAFTMENLVNRGGSVLSFICFRIVQSAAQTGRRDHLQCMLLSLHTDCQDQPTATLESGPNLDLVCCFFITAVLAAVVPLQ